MNAMRTLVIIVFFVIVSGYGMEIDLREKNEQEMESLNAPQEPLLATLSQEEKRTQIINKLSTIQDNVKRQIKNSSVVSIGQCNVLAPSLLISGFISPLAGTIILSVSTALGACFNVYSGSDTKEKLMDDMHDVAKRIKELKLVSDENIGSIAQTTDL